MLHKIDELKNYLKYLLTDTKEVEALYNDLLINVTGFFRDPEAFEELAEKVFPDIVKNRAGEEPIRIWVPGCSTGEEPYSIAIALLESLGDRATNTPIQIFATDISDVAIEKARAGVYLENITLEVSKERLRRFFVKLENGYQISKAIRDMCVFARQNVVKDPPFSKLDLISCRNVLIYLGPVLQNKIMPVFHYALKSAGFLMLGSSETIGGFTDLFGLADRKHKIYAKKTTLHRFPLDFSATNYMAATAEPGKRIARKEWRSFEPLKDADQIVISKYAPAGVIINDDSEILQFRGHTGFYLEPAAGEASLNLMRMAREGLLFDLRTAIHKARKEEAPVRKENVLVKNNGQTREINLEVIPFKAPQSKERYFLVLFEEAARQAAPELKKGKPKATKPGKTASLRPQAKGRDAEVARLKEELGATKEYLQSIIEEQEATNQELRSANEEIQSSNEELQSTNEELETAKEEMQSTNEELTTVNEELENRNLELSQANNDLMNLFANVHIPIIMLGNDLRLRRFTPMAEKVMNVIPTDVGRRMSDIKPNVNIPDLENLIFEVADTLRTVEREVRDLEGRWYSLRLRPYKTAENKIEGVVLTLVDIDALKRNFLIEQARGFAEAVVDTVREPLVVLDAALRVKKANRSFYNTFSVARDETENFSIYELGNRQWNIPQLRTLLEEILPQNSYFENFEVEHDFPQLGRRKMLLNARRLEWREGGEPMILLVTSDVTERAELVR
ncbi:MAG: CheR family methyltransferase, partial [bacterium]